MHCDEDEGTTLDTSHSGSTFFPKNMQRSCAKLLPISGCQRVRSLLIYCGQYSFHNNLFSLAADWQESEPRVFRLVRGIFHLSILMTTHLLLDAFVDETNYSPLGNEDEVDGPNTTWLQAHSSSSPLRYTVWFEKFRLTCIAGWHYFVVRCDGASLRFNGTTRHLAFWQSSFAATWRALCGLALAQPHAQRRTVDGFVVGKYILGLVFNFFGMLFRIIYHC